MNKERLLNVAKALREAPEPEKFTMTHMVHDCGTPACAMGHYAARGDLQDVFVIDRGMRQKFAYVTLSNGGHNVWPSMMKHFDISRVECDELFEVDGCDRAETAIAAAEFIERFVASQS
jgi:hypothetical protein